MFVLVYRGHPLVHDVTVVRTCATQTTAYALGGLSLNEANQVRDPMGTTKGPHVFLGILIAV